MARARAWAGARVEVKSRVDPLLWAMMADMTLEEGSEVWIKAQPGVCVLLECPSRWYVGVVETRTSSTSVLAAPALMIHDLGDAGLFLDGTPSTQCEHTPLPRGQRAQHGHDRLL